MHGEFVLHPLALLFHRDHLRRKAVCSTNHPLAVKAGIGEQQAEFGRLTATRSKRVTDRVALLLVADDYVVPAPLEPREVDVCGPVEVTWLSTCLSV